MTRPILGFLAEFKPVPPPDDMPQDDLVAAIDPELAEAERIAALVEAARREGFSDGERTAGAAAADRLRALGDDHAAHLAAERLRWAEAEGAALAVGLRTGLAALETTLADNLAAVVTPLIEPALRRKATQELVQALGALIAGTHGALVEIRGPADILEPMGAAFAGNEAVVLTPSEGTDVLVEAGDTTIRSQLQAWSECFEKALLVSA